MFEFFFEEYKKNIYKRNRFRKNIPVSEWIWFAITIASLLLVLVLWYVGQIIAFGICVLVTIVFYTILMLLIDRHRDRCHDDIMAEYRRRMIYSLEKMLQEKKYNLYSVAGINWLIACCKEAIDKKKHSLPHIGDSFLKWVFPWVTLLLGTWLGKRSDLLSGSNVFMLLVIIIGMWLVGMVCTAVICQVPKDISWILGLTGAALPFLLSDLEYIRAFVSESSHAVQPFQHA